jgi:hypothetical protein
MANKLRKQHVLLLHEALDRTHVASAFVQSILMDHGGVAAVPKAVRKIDRAVELLEDAYRIIRRATLDKDKIPSPKAKKRKKRKGSGKHPEHSDTIPVVKAKKRTKRKGRK